MPTFSGGLSLMSSGSESRQVDKRAQIRCIDETLGSLMCRL